VAWIRVHNVVFFCIPSDAVTSVFDHKHSSRLGAQKREEGHIIYSNRLDKFHVACRHDIHDNFTEGVPRAFFSDGGVDLVGKSHSVRNTVESTIPNFRLMQLTYKIPNRRFMFAECKVKSVECFFLSSFEIYELMVCELV
jgi:hypothetical protein